MTAVAAGESCSEPGQDGCTEITGQPNVSLRPVLKPSTIASDPVAQEEGS